MTNDTNKEIVIQLIKLKDIHRDEVVEILLNRVDTNYLEYIVQDLLNANTRYEVKGL